MFKNLPLIALCSLVFSFFNSCTNDVGSFEAGPVASYTLSSTAPVIAGVYVAGRQMNSGNTVTFQVNVTARGKYTVRTATQNGVYFEASSIFTSTGQQSLVLYGIGIPTSAGTFTYSAGSNSSNSFGITFSSTAPAASFTYAGGTGACTAPSINGVYAAGVAMGAGNYVDLTVNVTAIGAYSVSTNSAGGINFSASGTFGTIGANQTIRLMASGTPSGAGTYSFTPSGGCSFSINVLPPPPPASFTYTCAAPSISGTFAAGTALTSASTITVPVNVTSTGLYTVTTDPQNGVTFSASGVFTVLGPQSIVFTSTNTPSAAGTFNYTPSGAGCSFGITYTGGGGGGGGSSFITCKVNNVVTNFNDNIFASLDQGSSPYMFDTDGDLTGGSDNFKISLSDDNNLIAVGTTYNNYTLSNNVKYCSIVYTVGGTLYSNSFTNSNSFSVTITAITPTTVSGTFSGTLYENVVGPATKSITAGTFTVPY